MALEEIILKKYNQFKEERLNSPYGLRSIRDLVLIELTENLWIVTACDSDGGIGPKEGDSFFSTGYELGRFAARVPLIEILASGSIPIIVIDTLTVEMEPTGKEIIRGIKDEAALAGIKNNLAITGSTEDNVKTIQTGIGVVVIGIVTKEDFKSASSLDGDLIVLIGLPKSAPEFKINYDDVDIINPAIIMELRKYDFVHDILPIGSKGIQHEFSELAKSAELIGEYKTELMIDISKSAGPSTCCLVSLPEEKLNDLKNKMKLPINIIGRVRKR
ncbi:MAG: AIR synthase related protein [Melioribacteraceae bacterium]